MTRPLKIRGGLTTSGATAPMYQRQIRTLVVATTKKRMLELLVKAFGPMSRSYFDDFWAETGNEVEVACIKQGEGVYVPGFVRYERKA